MKAFTNYEDVREAHRTGVLQINIGTPDHKVWKDVSPESGVFFSRPLDEYRAKPSPRTMPKFFVVPVDPAVSHREFETGREAANFLWGKDPEQWCVYTRTRLNSLDIRKIADHLDSL